MSEVNLSPENSSTSRRSRIRRWHVILFVAACVVVAMYWWSGLTTGRTLFPSEPISVRINIPFDYDSERSRSEDVQRVKDAGVELKSIIESRLETNGFSRAVPEGSREIDLYEGTFQGSPQIQLRLEDLDDVDEGGIYYRLSFDYTCQIPRSSLRYQDKVAKSIIDFENVLRSWIDDCHRQFLNDSPEFR